MTLGNTQVPYRGVVYDIYECILTPGTRDLTITSLEKVCAGVNLNGNHATLRGIYGKGNGTGTALLYFILHYCRTRGCTSLSGVISPVDDAERLREWYKKHGFQVVLSESDMVYDISINL